MVSKSGGFVYTGNIEAELLKAHEYVQGPASIDNHMHPMGITAPKVLCTDIYEQYNKVEAPVSMAFSGTIWMLDLSHRFIGIDKLDLSRMGRALDLVQ